MFKKIFSTIFLILGLFFIFQGLFDFSKRIGLHKVSPNTKITTLQPTETPTQIAISSISLSLPVEPVILKNTTWPTSQTGVSFLQNSGNLGKPGNLIFYGHNWKNLLGSLKKVKVGDSIVLNNTSSESFTYSVLYIAEVDPTDVSILEDTSDERLTF
jgi:LPXTG-site transpeptidase (sortase) family protein